MVSVGNPLSGTISSQINSDSILAKKVGNSISSGINQLAESTDKFLGNSLNDNVRVLNAVNKSLNYASNLLRTSYKNLESIASSVVQLLEITSGAAGLAPDKIKTLEAALSSQKEQVELILKTANFDGRNLFDGSNSKMSVRAGAETNYTTTISVSNIGDGKVWKSDLSKELNTLLLASTAIATDSTYFANAGELQKSVDANRNHISDALQNKTNVPVTGAGGAMTDANLAALIIKLRDGDSNWGEKLAIMAPETLKALDAANAGETFKDTDATKLTTALGVTLGGGTNLDEFKSMILGDKFKLGTEADRAISSDLFKGALDAIRGEQANLENQIDKLDGMSESLSKNAVITKEAADGYIGTDQVSASQHYSELIKQIQAAIATSNAGNQLASAILQAIQSATRG